MSTSVMVGYACRYGDLLLRAEAVTAALPEGGLGVDLQPKGEVRSLIKYHAVVLGAPLYMFRL